MFSLKNEYTYFDFNVKTVSFNETVVTYVLCFFKLRQMFQLQFQSDLKASTTELSNCGHANSTWYLYILMPDCYFLATGSDKNANIFL